MKKIILIAIFLIPSLLSFAQWTFQPTISLGGSGLYYPEKNPYGLSSGGGFVGGLDAEFSYGSNEVFFFNFGTGIHYTKHVDSLFDGKACWLPIYAGGRIGDALFIETYLGYNIPIGSSSIGYVHGWFAELGVGMNLDPLLLCLDLGFLNVFGNTSVFYVPKENVAIRSGFSLSVKIKIRFPLNDD